MKINALLMDVRDNVVTCVADIAAGSDVLYREGEEIRAVKALEPIPCWHKAALCDLKKDEAVVKYGESLGVMTAPVSRGSWVAHHNLVSVPRDYESEMLKI